MTGRADFFEDGGWNCVCYQCGRKRKASMMKRHWQGYWVCPEHWEPRQPQDFVRSVPDVQTPPWAQPMPADIFVPTAWTQFPQDVVTVSGGTSSGYMLTYSDYFAEDYLLQTMPEVIITWTAFRTFTDAVAVVDVASVRVAQSLSDTVTTGDAIVCVVQQAFSDSVVTAQAGLIFSQDYVAFDYFAADYIGTTLVTF